jgi:type IV pilus assembly protein PilY1
MGMPVGLTISMTSTPSGYSVPQPYDYVEAAITYTPGTYWKVNPTTCGTMAAPVASNLANGTCAYGPDGQLLSRVDLRVAAGPITVPAGRTDCVGGTTCTLAEEKQNFANWFQYYRKRHLLVNAALGNAYDGLQGLRAGFFQFNNLADVTMYNFDSGSSATNSTRLIGALYQNTGSGGTPTRDAVDYIGKQFRRTDSAAPITNYCQFNAAFVITDGFATSGGPTVTPGNYDAQTPTTTAYAYNKQFNTNASTVITAPYADTFSNTMADMAMKMYSENPRPDLLPVGGVPVDKSDVSPSADRNPNLHVNMYGMILNLTGRIFGNTSTPALINQNNDPYTYPPDWSNVPLGDTTALNRDMSAIDELWHATINGRGQMLLATSPEVTRDAVLTVVANVVSKGGAAAAVAVSNPNPVAGDNSAYASNYNSGAWSGDINAYALDLASGQPSTTPLWNPSPQHLLAARDYTTRVIATYNGTTGVPFQWASLTSSQQIVLNSDPQVLSFLRGDRTQEGVKFRGRGPRAPYPNNVVSDNVAVLGDIVALCYADARALAEPSRMGALEL